MAWTHIKTKLNGSDDPTPHHHHHHHHHQNLSLVFFVWRASKFAQIQISANVGQVSHNTCKCRATKKWWGAFLCVSWKKKNWKKVLVSCLIFVDLFWGQVPLFVKHFTTWCWSEKETHLINVHIPDPVREKSPPLDLVEFEVALCHHCFAKFSTSHTS